MFMGDNPKSLRQILFNKEFHNGEQEELPIEWTYVLINQPQELDRINGRLYEQLRLSGPSGEGIAAEGITQWDLENIAPKESLHARYLNFRSQAQSLRKPKQVYDSEKFRKDRNLRLFTETEFANYIETFQKRNGIYVPQD